jgi:DNA ligase (NAD+)
VKVEKATLNNLSWLQELGVQLGSRVSLVRSGDVIPKIVEVLDSASESTAIVPPPACPECGTPTSTVRDEDDTNGSSMTILCRNKECPGRVREMLTYVADRTVLEIDALGPNLATRLIESEGVKNLADLFMFGNRAQSNSHGGELSDLRGYLAERSFPVELTLRMLNSLEVAKSAPWDRWLAAFCIPMVGRRLGKMLAKSLRLQPDDLLVLADKLASIQLSELEGLGTSKLGAIHSYANDPAWRQMLVTLYEQGVRPAATIHALPAAGQSLSGVCFVITGEFEQFGTREEITAKLEALGAVAKSSVSKNVTHLLVGTSPGKSKLAKAQMLGIQEYAVDWLRQVLG